MDDERLAECLEAYMAERDSRSDSSVDSQPSLEVPNDIRDDFQSARASLDMLERIWPGTPIDGDAESDRNLSRLLGSVFAFPGFGEPRKLGRFQIERELGRGGGGIVFLAFDPELERHIALKVPKPEVLASPDLRARFLRESRTLALLQHPNIAPVFEAGSDGPISYIAAAYFQAGDLATWLASQMQPVRPRTAAVWLRAIVDALQYSHARGVLHRDLKPSNILLETLDKSEREDDLKFRPRLADFGLARLESDHEHLTTTNAVVGTPGFMAPEQVDGRNDEVTIAADIYGLGAILYATLTGRPPFAGKTPWETLNAVRHELPPSPRQFAAEIPIDLEAICLKCLEKHPAHRYATAGELGADLDRFLRGDVVKARRPGFLERAVYQARRRPQVTGLLAVTLASITTALILGIDRFQDSKRLNAELRASLVRERQRHREVQRANYDTNFRFICQTLNQGAPSQVAASLANLIPAPGQEDFRDFAWHYLWRQVRGLASIPAHQSIVSSLGLTPDGRWIVSSDGRGSFCVHDTLSLRKLAQWESPCSEQHRIAIHRSGKWAAYVRKPTRTETSNTEVEVRDLPNGKLHLTKRALLPEATSVQFAANGRELLVAGVNERGRSALIAWDFTTDQVRTIFEGNWQSFVAIAAAPVGTAVALSERGGPKDYNHSRIVLLDSIEAPVPHAVIDSHLPALWLEFSPDAKLLAIGCPNNSVSVLEIANYNLLWHKVFEQVFTRVSMAWVESGKALAVGRNNPQTHRLEFFDARTGAPHEEPTSDRFIFGVAIGDSNDNLFYIGESSGVIRRLQCPTVTPFRSLTGHKREVWDVRFSPDGNKLATASDDATIKLWNVANGKELQTLKGHEALVHSIDFTPDGQRIVSGSFDHTIGIWNVASGQIERRWSAHRSPVRVVAVAPDGKSLASIASEGNLKFWDLAATGKPRWTRKTDQGRIYALAFSPDGKHLVATIGNKFLAILDVANGNTIAELRHKSSIWSVRYSPDGASLFLGDSEGVAAVWDGKSEILNRQWQAHENGIRSMDVSQDGCLLATAGLNSIRLWRSDTADAILRLPGHSANIVSTRFCPTGHRLASSAMDGSVHLWPSEN